MLIVGRCTLLMCGSGRPDVFTYMFVDLCLSNQFLVKGLLSALDFWIASYLVQSIPRD